MSAFVLINSMQCWKLLKFQFNSRCSTFVPPYTAFCDSRIGNTIPKEISKTNLLWIIQNSKNSAILVVHLIFVTLQTSLKMKWKKKNPYKINSFHELKIYIYMINESKLSGFACLFVHPPIPNKKCSSRVGNYLIQKRHGTSLRKKNWTWVTFLFIKRLCV